MMYSVVCYFSKLENIVHYKAQNKTQLQRTSASMPPLPLEVYKNKKKADEEVEFERERESQLEETYISILQGFYDTVHCFSAFVTQFQM